MVTPSPLQADQAEMEGLRGQISNAMVALQREQALVEVLKKEVEKATRGGAVLAGPEGQRLQQLMDEVGVARPGVGFAGAPGGGLISSCMGQA